MARARMEKIDFKSWRGDIPISSLYTAGTGGQTFFTALKARGELIGSRCGPCCQVYVPARSFCERCFAELSETAKVAPSGTVKSFTFCHLDHEGKRLRHPAGFALVQLDGATTLLLHRLLDVKNPSQIAIGSRVTTIIRPKAKRTGSILDIEGFRLLS